MCILGALFGILDCTDYLLRPHQCWTLEILNTDRDSSQTDRKARSGPCCFRDSLSRIPFRYHPLNFERHREY